MVTVASGGRVAIVTGGSRGIGAETVNRLAALGYAVVVDYVHDQQTAEAVVDAVLDANGTAVAIRADIADDLDVERLFTQTIETFGGVDAVVHVVRGHVSATPLMNLAPAEFDAIHRTSLRATFMVNRSAAQQVRDGGSIINLISSVARSVLPDYGAHAATAVAAQMLTRTLAVELRGRDITVNGVALDIERDCAPRRVAEVITYLLSEPGQALTGQILQL